MVRYLPILAVAAGLIVWTAQTTRADDDNRRVKVYRYDDSGGRQPRFYYYNRPYPYGATGFYYSYGTPYYYGYPYRFSYGYPYYYPGYPYGYGYFYQYPLPLYYRNSW